MAKLRTVGDDIDRAFDLTEGRRAASLFLAVIGGRRLASTERDVVASVCINLYSFGARPRIPNGRLAAPQPHGLIASRVSSIIRSPVAILLVELRAALRLHTLNVLSLLDKECGHLLRRDSFGGSPFRRLHRLD